MNLKLYRKDFQVWKNEVYFLPTVKVFIGDRVKVVVVRKYTVVCSGISYSITW